jgi:four helix bundle protein
VLFKFEKLEIWTQALDYVDCCYDIADQLPDREKYNLHQQLSRAEVSIALNIAEGSIGQSDPEQAQFLKISNRSVIETVACFHLIHRRDYLTSTTPLRGAYKMAHKLSAKIQSMRNALGGASCMHEDLAEYGVPDYCPF